MLVDVMLETQGVHIVTDNRPRMHTHQDRPQLSACITGCLFYLADVSVYADGGAGTQCCKENDTTCTTGAAVDKKWMIKIQQAHCENTATTAA